MSQPSQPQRQFQPGPAGSRTGSQTPARSSGGIGLPSSRRGRLSLIALLLALAALLLVPAVVFAAAPTNAPSGVTATAGDGTMTVRWTATHGATGGYQYRYTDNLLVTLGPADPPDWSNEQSTSNTSVTIPAGTLTVGMTYYFQVSGKDNNNPINYDETSEWSAGKEQRAAPSKLSNLTATAGNAQVTLNWDDPNDSTIFDYSYRRDDGGGFPNTWTNFTTNTNEYAVTRLTNGTEYRFQVRAKNNQ